MSARTPIILPESWSTSLKVRRSRSCPVPVSSDSRYSSMGGITSWYPCTRNSSSSFARIRSMRCACGGRMSSNFSGRSQLRIGKGSNGLAEEKQDQQADQHRRKPEKTDLSVSELRDAAERVAPQRREKKREHALDDQHQGKSHYERGAHSLAALPRISEILEELGIGIEHDDIALVLEGGPVGVEAAIEGVELGILIEGARVDGGRLSVAFALDALGVAVGFGDDDLARAVGLGADFLRQGEALRARIGRNALALRVHASIDGFAHFLRQLDALEPDVDDLHADLGDVVLHLFADDAHDVVALARHHVVHGALAELLAQRRLYRLRQPRLSALLVALDADVVLLHVLDAPHDEGVDQDVFLLRGDEALGVGCIQRQDSFVEIAHVLDQRNLEIQARLVDQILDLPELEHDGPLALIHGERGEGCEQDRARDDREDDSSAAVHGRSPLSRPRSASRERAPVSGAGGGSVNRDGADDACPSGCALAVVIWMILSRGR